MALTSLPFGPLLTILEHLDDGCLYPLGLLSHRLNHLAFDILINRHKHTTYSISTTLSLNLPLNRKILSILRLSFFPIHTHYLDCNFHYEAEDVATFASDFQQFLDILVTPRQGAYGLTFHTIEVVSVHLSHGLTLRDKEICNAVFLRCTSCRRVEISSDNGLHRFYDRRTSTWDGHYSITNHGLYERMSSRSLPKLPFKCIASASYTLMKPTRIRGFVLRRVKVSNHHTFMPEDFARDVLNWKAVQELELPNDSKLRGEGWAGVLSGIASAATTLRRLTLDARGILAQDLLNFLSHLHQLSCLYITSSHHIHNFDDLWLATGVKKKHVFIRSLASLTAPPMYSAAILAAKLPRLRSVTIEVSGSIHLFSLPTQKIFATIMSHLQTQARKITLDLRITFGYDFIPSMVYNLNDYVLSSVGHSEYSGIVAPFVMFEQVAVHGVNPHLIPYGYDTYTYHQVLARWLRLFKSLRRIRFSDGPDQFADQPSIYPLLSVIHAQCPTVKFVDILFTEYEIEKALFEHESVKDPPTNIRTFGDLDQDVMYVVLQYLDPEDIYHLSGLCRNLQSLALPIYLRRRGFLDPSLNTDISVSFNELEPLVDVSALTLSSVGVIEQLSISLFPHISAFLVFEFLHRTLRFVRGLSKISVVKLDFGGQPCSMAAVVSERSRVTWTRLILSILCTLAEKSTTMVATGHGTLGDLTFSPSDYNLGSGTRLPSPGVQFPVNHRLTKLDLDSASLLLPVFRDWAIEGLRNSESVTSLHLWHLSSRVASLLPRLSAAFPVVSQLTLSGFDILPADILEALENFKTLEVVRLNSCQWYWENRIDGRDIRPVPIGGQLPGLKRLRNLSTSMEYASFLVHDESAIPQLEKLTIEFLHPFPPWAHPIVTTKTLSRAVGLLITRPNFLQLTLDLHIPTITAITPDDMSDDGWEVVANSTTRLILRQRHLSPHLDTGTNELSITTERVRCWVTLFTRLQELAFDEIADTETLDLVLEKLDVWNICPTLQTLSVNGNVRHNVACPL